MTAMVVYRRHAAWVATSVIITIGAVLTAIAVVLGVLGALYLGRELTPSPLPTASAKLVTEGPYRFVRHPIYTAVTVLGVGISLRSGSVMGTVAFIGLIILFNFKARWEETRLAMSFPGYESYMNTTGRFLPKPNVDRSRRRILGPSDSTAGIFHHLGPVAPTGRAADF